MAIESESAKPAAEATDKPMEVLLEEGRTLLRGAQADVEQAIQLICKALELCVQKHGETALESAEYYYAYGHALLLKVENEGDLFGDAVKKASKESEEKGDGLWEEAEEGDEAEAEEDETEAKKAEEKTAEEEKKPEEVKQEEKKAEDPADPKGKGKGKLKEEEKELVSVEDVKEGEGEGDEEEEGEEEEEEGGGEAAEGGEEEGSDLQLSWETLEMARKIYEAHSDKDQCLLELAKVHTRLGDNCLESENFVEAISDYNKALEIRQKLLDQDHRQLADSQFNLSVAHQLSGDLPKAATHVQEAINIMERRIKSMKATLEGKAPSAVASSSSSSAPSPPAVQPSREEMERDITDAEGILAGLKEKLEEVTPDPMLVSTAGAASDTSAGTPAVTKEMVSNSVTKILKGDPNLVLSAPTDVVATANNLGVFGRSTKRARMDLAAANNKENQKEKAPSNGVKGDVTKDKAESTKEGTPTNGVAATKAASPVPAGADKVGQKRRLQDLAGDSH